MSHSAMIKPNCYINSLKNPENNKLNEVNS